MFKLLAWEISQRQIEAAGQIAAVMAGSGFAPWRPMMEQTLAPYADLNKLLSPNVLVVLKTYIQLINNMHAAGSRELLFNFIPSLGVCILVFIAFLTACNFVGLFTTRIILARVTESRMKAAGQAS